MTGHGPYWPRTGLSWDSRWWAESIHHACCACAPTCPRIAPFSRGPPACAHHLTGKMMPTSIHAEDECLGETLQAEGGSAAHGPSTDWWQRGKLGNALYRPRSQSICTARLRVPLTGCPRVSSGRVFNGKTGQPAALPLHVRPSMYHTATTVAEAHGKLLGWRGGRSKLLEWAQKFRFL